MHSSDHIQPIFYFPNAKKYFKFEQNIREFLLVCMIFRFNFMLGIFLRHYKSYVFTKIMSKIEI